jgi:ubiquitin carboxyl-terminal hydrolase 7
VTFVDKNTPNEDGFTLTLSLKLKYDEFAKIVGDHLNYDYLKLQFFRSNVYDLKPTTVNPNQSIKYNQEFLLKDAFNLMGKPQQQGQQQGAQVKKLFYQKLNIKISELEERRQFKCVWVSLNLKVEKEITLMPFKKATVKELLNECKNELINLELIPNEANAEQPFKLRLAEVVACKMHRIFKEDVLIEILETTTPNKVYRVEQIPVEELNLNVNNMTVNVNKGEEFLLGVAHFTKEIYATFGTPFFFKCKQGELFKDIKQRIQKKLDVSDKEFATVRFLINLKISHNLLEF